MMRLDFDNAAAPDLDHEWLLTNGLGGFAMGTPHGIHRRRYHGLLIAAAQPPGRRTVVLHSVAEQVTIGGRTVKLWSQPFGADAAISPIGWQSLDAFEHDAPSNTCTWIWQTDRFVLRRTLVLAEGTNALTVRWSVEELEDEADLHVRLLMPLRPFHELGGADACRAVPSKDRLQVERADLRASAMLSDGQARLVHDPQVWRDFALVAERDRGLDWRDDVFSPGSLDAQFGPDSATGIELTITLDEPHAARPERVRPRSADLSEEPVRAHLEAAADQFIVGCMADDRWGTTIIAGYPWFGDWGRDAMISLPGLLLTSGRLRAARDVLHVFASQRRGGLIPNCFDDTSGEPLFNTVDASLWYVRALWEYTQAGGEAEDALIAAAREVIRAYRHGTDFGIGLSRDGLLAAGAEGVAVTWMDAVRGGEIFTPRHGKAIEINALWYNALRCLADLVEASNEHDAAELREMAGHTALSMQMNFWWPQRQCCHDVLRPTERPASVATVAPDDAYRFTSYQAAHQDAAAETVIDWVGDDRLRPNQILAVSMPYSPLTREQQQSVVHVVREHLLTPVGLRTLSVDDPAYEGRYEGDLMARDRAYHNGTVWPWLVGPYCEALLRTGDFSADSKREVRQTIQPLIDTLNDGCLGQVAEVYDGDPPHRPSGCLAQAWSVAELLRVLSLLERDA